MNIYILKGTEAKGPFAVEQVVDSIRKGEFLMSDLAWHEGMSEWQPIHKLPEIVSIVLPPIHKSSGDHESAVVPAPSQNITKQKNDERAGIGQIVMTTDQIDSDKLKLPAILLCLFVGAFGIHAFYADRYKQGLMFMLLFIVAVMASSAGDKTHPDTPAIMGLILFIILIIAVVATAIRIALGKYRDGHGDRITRWSDKRFKYSGLIFACVFGAVLLLIIVSSIVTVIGALSAAP